MDLVGQVALLGLRLRRLAPRLVTAWTGDPGLARRVDDEPPPNPAQVQTSARLLAAQLPTAGLAETTTAHLVGQLATIGVRAGTLAGRAPGYQARVRICLQVEAELADPEAYVRAHGELDALLPGGGPLTDRWAEHRRTVAGPPALLARAAAAVTDALRERVGDEFHLPAGEQVVLRLDRTARWNGFAGGAAGRSTTVTLAADRPCWLGRLAQLIAHESYPGHHVQRLLRQSAATRRPELALELLGGPLAVLDEGLAEQALAIAVGPGWGGWLAEVLAPLGRGALGSAYNGPLLEQIALAAAPLGRARADAALLLQHSGSAAAAAHLQRWALSTPAGARRVLDFLADPVWCDYIWAPVLGAGLVGQWLGPDPDPLPRVAALLQDPQPASTLAPAAAGTAG